MGGERGSRLPEPPGLAPRLDPEGSTVPLKRKDEVLSPSPAPAQYPDPVGTSGPPVSGGGLSACPRQDEQVCRGKGPTLSVPAPVRLESFCSPDPPPRQAHSRSSCAGQKAGIWGPVRAANSTAQPETSAGWSRRGRREQSRVCPPTRPSVRLHSPAHQARWHGEGCTGVAAGRPAGLSKHV